MNNLAIRKMNELKNKKKKGFTLVELIIVIAIIAILAAIAIPKFGAVRENSNKTADIATAKNIALATSKAIAEGKLSYSAAIPASPLNAVGGTGGYDLTKDLDGITATTNLKTTGYTSATFQVAVDATGNVTVTESGGKILYPTTDTAFTAK